MVDLSRWNPEQTVEWSLQGPHPGGGRVGQRAPGLYTGSTYWRCLATQWARALRCHSCEVPGSIPESQCDSGTGAEDQCFMETVSLLGDDRRDRWRVGLVAQNCAKNPNMVHLKMIKVGEIHSVCILPQF